MSQFRFVDDDTNNQTEPAAPPTSPVASPVPPTPTTAPGVTPTAPVDAQPTAPTLPISRPSVPTPPVPTPPIARPAAPQSTTPQSATQAPVARPAAPPSANRATNASQSTLNAAAPQGGPRAPTPAANNASARVGPAPNAPMANPAIPYVAQTHPAQAAVPDDSVKFHDGLPWRVWLSKLDPFALWLFRIAAITGGLALLYLVAAIMGGAGQAVTAEAGAAEKAAQIAHDMRLAATILQWSLMAIALCSIVLMLDVSWVGPTIAGLGIVLHFGAPFALHAVGQSPATAATAHVLQRAGFALLIMGLMKCAIDLMQWLIGLPERMKQKATVGDPRKAEAAQQRIARDATMFSPCWKLPFCREVIRVQCPAFLARQRCWKFGRGCYCDEEMIARIIRGATLEQIKAPTRMSQAKKPPCGRCHIYLEHQSLKYKMMSPLGVPLSGLLIYLAWPFYIGAFGALSKSLDAVWSRLSFDPRSMATGVLKADDASKATVDSINAMTPEQMQQWSQNLFGVILGFFVLIYVSKMIEWAIYKMKW